MLLDCLFQKSEPHNAGRIRRAAVSTVSSTLAVLLVCAATASAQNFRRVPGAARYPLSQQTPPGVSGYWAGAVGKANDPRPQPIRVVLPSKGTVAIYGSPRGNPLKRPAPASFGVGVGYTYRLQITDMPEFPGARVFPSVEIIDRLHPPRGMEHNFPIPIVLSRQDIEFALEGRFVTKVVYLEQPQIATPLSAPIPEQTVAPYRNAVAVADQRGRPVAIVRIGGRRLNTGRPDSGNFGRGGPVTIVPEPTPAKKN